MILSILQTRIHINVPYIISLSYATGIFLRISLSPYFLYLNLVSAALQLESRSVNLHRSDIANDGHQSICSGY